MDARNNQDNTWGYEPAIEDDIQAMADALKHDPWDDPHDIEYWVWNGARLVRASPAEQAAIQEMERAQSARRRLAQWESAQQRQRQLRIFVRISQIITSWRHRWHDGGRPEASPRRQHRNEK